MSEIIIPLLTLIAFALISGIDNMNFISLPAGIWPNEKRNQLRNWGIGQAVVFRLILLTGIAWLLKSDLPSVTARGIEFSVKVIILISGGVYLIWKCTGEIVHTPELAMGKNKLKAAVGLFKKLVTQIIILVLVFSIDSIITAAGMGKGIWILYVAVIVSSVIKRIASNPVGKFIARHASFKILALYFVIITGIVLSGEGLHFDIPIGFIYCFMASPFIVIFFR
jgi:predicted tellurium resistance membrane protein TerC